MFEFGLVKGFISNIESVSKPIFRPVKSCDIGWRFQHSEIWWRPRIISECVCDIEDFICCIKLFIDHVKT